MKTKPKSRASSCAVVPAAKRSLVPAPAASQAALVAMPEPGEALDRAGRVNFFHRLSREAGVVSIRAALAAGLELLAAKEELSGGFQKWVQTKCSFGVTTAYKYMATVQRSLPEEALPKLLAGSDAQREREIEEVASSTDSRTLTDLYDDLGIVRKTPSNLGGARPGAGRKPKHALSNEEIAAQAAALAADPEMAAKECFDLLDRLVAWANGPAGFAALPDKDLARATTLLGDLGFRAGSALAERKRGARGKAAAK